MNITEINFLIFLLGQLCFLTVTYALHENINVRLKNGNEIIELNWKRVEQFVANGNLPVWYAEKDETPYLLPRIMEEIGDFITYHDVEKSSAVVYFTKFNCIYGVVDTRFHIVRLPLGNVGETIDLEVGSDWVISYEKKNREGYFHNGQSDWLSNLFNTEQINFINSLIDSTGAKSSAPFTGTASESSSNNIDTHNAISSDSESLVGHQNVVGEVAIKSNAKPTTLYPELLVFVTHEIYSVFKQAYGKHAIKFLIMYYIVYFNAINMLFSKLAVDQISIHINIAGLVIEDEPRVFLYTIEKVSQKDGSVQYRFRDGIFLFRFPQYITQHSNVFPEDSFDFIFISTNYGMKRKNDKYHGISRTAVNIYRQRYIKRPLENILGCIVQSNNDFSDYVTTTREIAQLMGMEHDLLSGGVHYSKIQCYAIMQKSTSHCHSCLTWSEKSRDELRTYVRFNRNHCFLLNYPRSLYPHGQPIHSMNPEDQCMCYQFPAATLDVMYMVFIPEDSCYKPMRCSFNQNPEMLTPWPLDGTPCGRNKVCWRKRCVDLK